MPQNQLSNFLLLSVGLVEQLYRQHTKSVAPVNSPMWPTALTNVCPYLERLLYSLNEQSDSRRARSLVELQVVGGVEDLAQRSRRVSRVLTDDRAPLQFLQAAPEGSDDTLAEVVDGIDQSVGDLLAELPKYQILDLLEALSGSFDIGSLHAHFETDIFVVNLDDLEESYWDFKTIHDEEK